MKTCLALLLGLLSLLGTGAHAGQGATVLYVATERVTDLALGYRHYPQVARLGFGSADKPWHAWFGGGTEMRPLLHLPGYTAGSAVSVSAARLMGNRFDGKAWNSAFTALASFDQDGNGIVEGAELRDLYVWVDFEGDGSIANRPDALRPATFYYTAFDLRGGAKNRGGHARQGGLMPFSVLVPNASRIHLLELDVSQSWASRTEGLLADALPTGLGPRDSAHPLNGRWRWKVSNPEAWKDSSRPWYEEPSGQLLLSVHAGRIVGLVQSVGPHSDRINLPLEGSWRDGSAQWTSVSPLGLTRSEVRLESRFGHPVLRARSWSNRNGRIQQWTWEAHHDRPLE